MSSNNTNAIYRKSLQIIEDSKSISKNDSKIILNLSSFSYKKKYKNPLNKSLDEKDKFKNKLNLSKNSNIYLKKFKNKYNLNKSDLSEDTITDMNNYVDINSIPLKEIDLKNFNEISGNNIIENLNEKDNNEIEEHPITKIKLSPPPKINLINIINNNHKLTSIKTNESNKNSLINDFKNNKNDFSFNFIHPETINLSIQKFVSLLENNTLFYLLCFLTVDDLKNLLNLNKHVRLIINTLLTNVYYKEIKSKIKKYKKIIEILKSKINITKIRKSLKIDIISKIRLLPILEENNNSKNISLIYIYKNIINKENNKKEKYLDYYSFDIFSENYDNYPSIYMLREFTSFNLDNLQKPYIQPILPFKDYDQILLNFQIFSPQNYFVDPKEIRIKIKENQIETKNLSYPRICEYENICNHWKNLSYLKDKNIIYDEIEKMFKPNFEIIRVLFDDIGYLVFKVFLKAIKTGVIDNKEEIGIKFIIKEKKDVIENEVKKNDLLFEHSNTFELRVGDRIIFYLTNNK